MPKINLTFDVKSGETRVEAHGFIGPSCAAATEFLRNTLGQCRDFQEKAEWYEVNLELSGNINTNLCG